MLEKLVSGLERPDVVLIEDSLEQPGRGLLKAFLIGLADRVNTIHLYLYELPPSHFTIGIPSYVMEKLTIHDMSSDLYGWISGVASLDIVLDKPQIPSGQKAALVFDYLGYLVRDKSSAHVCQMLHRLAGRTNSASTDSAVEQIFAVVHQDVQERAILKPLEYTARCVLNLSRTLIKDGALVSSCRAFIRDSSGDLRTSNETFVLSESFSVSAMKISKPVAVQTSKPAPDPTSNLTFNLTLKKDEEDAKRQVVLPYLSARARDDLVAGGAGVQRRMTQNLKDVDLEEELEDEDPDDDLDI